MANLSTYLENALINHIFRNSAYTSPTTVYLGLVTNSAVDGDMEAGTLTNEVTAYTGNRPSTTWSAPADVGGKATTKNSTAAVEYAAMPSCTVKYVIVCDGATKSAGNILVFLPLSSAQVVASGQTLRFPIDSLVFDLA